MKQIILALFALSLAAPEARASPFIPDAEAWPRWQKSGPGAAVDYTPWNRFLQRYRSLGANGVARIAYAAVSPADRRALDAFIVALSGAPVDQMTRGEQKAFWINFYNAATVQVVLAHYPVRSIRKIHGGLLGLGPWRKKLFGVAGVPLSLNDIEHRLLRGNFRDPRIHYALNCASIGCPNLAGAAFESAQLDAQLDQAARDFINNPRALRVEKRRLVGSTIFKWYADDFGGRDGILPHVRRYASDKVKAMLQNRTRIDRYRYDWNLNAQD